MTLETRIVRLAGPVGPIEALLDLPSDDRPGEPRGLALVAHPHPLFGGNMQNKVTQTMARCFAQLGYAAVRPNFRGVGASAGQHDLGEGEQDDLLAVIAWMRQPANWQGIGASWADTVATLPLALAGFSFGSFVQSLVAQRLANEGVAVEGMVLVGTPTPKWQVANVPANSVVIHGEYDETIPLAGVLDWARPQELAVVVVPGADHFFHRRLHILRDLIARCWQPTVGLVS